MYLEKENRNDIMAYKQTFLLDDLEWNKNFTIFMDSLFSPFLGK